MKDWMAVPITVGIIAACLAITILAGNPLAFFLVVPVSAIWAALDASQIRQKCGSNDSILQDKDAAAILQSTKPVIVFAACFLFWIFGFPWYLTIRSRLLKRVRLLKEEPQNVG